MLEVFLSIDPYFGQTKSVNSHFEFESFKRAYEGLTLKQLVWLPEVVNYKT